MPATGPVLAIVRMGRTGLSGNIKAHPVIENRLPYSFIPQDARYRLPNAPGQRRRIVASGHVRALNGYVGSSRIRCDQHRPAGVLCYTTRANA